MDVCSLLRVDTTCYRRTFILFITRQVRMTRYRVIYKTPEKGGKQGIVTRWRPLLTTPDTFNGRWSGRVVGRSISQLLTIHPVEASINHGDVVYTRRVELNVESDFEDEDPSTFYVNGELAPRDRSNSLRTRRLCRRGSWGS